MFHFFLLKAVKAVKSSKCGSKALTSYREQTISCNQSLNDERLNQLHIMISFMFSIKCHSSCSAAAVLVLKTAENCRSGFVWHNAASILKLLVLDVSVWDDITEMGCPV